MMRLFLLMGSRAKTPQPCKFGTLANDLGKGRSWHCGMTKTVVTKQYDLNGSSSVPDGDTLSRERCMCEAFSLHLL